MVRKIKIKKIRKPRRKNKNGIPVFERGEDLTSFFRKNQDQEEEGFPGSSSVSGPESGPSARAGKQLKNKHGLPVLDGSASLGGLFEADSSKEVKENFSEMLDSSLKGKNIDALLREKSDRSLPVPVPLKKRLKRYPKAQRQLDLHGYDAVSARIRAESYLRTALKAGVFTLRIVVGKGLHSEHGAVLPDVVEDLLVKMKKEEVVLWFEWDRKNKSLSGAVIVYMKQFAY